MILTIWNQIGEPVINVMENKQKYFYLENTILMRFTIIFRKISIYINRKCPGCTLEAISKSYYVVVLPEDFKEGTTISLIVTNNE